MKNIPAKINSKICLDFSLTENANAKGMNAQIIVKKMFILPNHSSELIEFSGKKIQNN